MIRHRPLERGFAAGLAALAGYVDAIGFLHLGGYFVSFMSGNSTRLGVGLVYDLSEAAVPALLIVSFVGGVVIGAFVGVAALRHKRRAVLLCVALLLLAAALLHAGSFPSLAMIFAAAAMGASNGTFERDGEVSIGVTYMTGTLVKLGQRIAGALLGGDRLAWSWYLFLWLGLVAGAGIGAAVYREIGLGGLWYAAGAFAIASMVVPRDNGGP